VAALVSWAGLALTASTPVTVVTETARRQVMPVTSRGDAELLPIDQVIAGLGVTLLSDAAGGAATLTFQKREVGLYNKRSLASVQGDLRLLSSPVVFDAGHWLVPVDSIARLLAPLLDAKVEWRASSRVLLVGNVAIPRVTVTTFVTGDAARVVLEASEKVPFRVEQQEGRVTVSILRDLLDVPFQQQRLAGGIVEAVQFVGGKENLFAITLGRRFQQMKAVEQEGPTRLVLEFQGPPLSVAKAAAAAPAPRPTPTPEARMARTVVIDPGHGGEEVGAKGLQGSLEKDVTLSVARKLRALIVNQLGLQVFLTRDRDEDLGLDQRTAIANNYKADLFISIHSNASRARDAKGSEVYFLSYQASDDEGRRIAQLEGEAVPVPDAPPGLGSDVALILWDMAQAEHLEESSSLASRIQEELAVVTGSQGRGVKQAPFRVLVGAAMPAVLVEIAFISNPEEEKLLTSDAYQSKVATALVRGIARFEQQRASRGTFSRNAPGSGR
jgi:N-acetylmuramoyl-L-alanine amidase